MAKDDCRICRCYGTSLTVAEVREWESTVTSLREARLLLRWVAYSLDGLCHRCGRAQTLSGKATAPTREEYLSHLRDHLDVQIVGCAYCLLRQEDRERELQAHAAAGIVPPLDASAVSAPEPPEQVLDASAAAAPEFAQGDHVLAEVTKGDDGQGGSHAR